MKKAILLLFVLGLVVVPSIVLAQDADDPFGLDYPKDVGLGTQEVRTVAVNIIQSLLGLLGILALIIILIGGFRWMTAAGNEENVAAAKKTIGAGIIGLIIIFFAYAIVAFIFNVVGGSLV